MYSVLKLIVHSSYQNTSQGRGGGGQEVGTIFQDHSFVRDQ